MSSQSATPCLDPAGAWPVLLSLSGRSADGNGVVADLLACFLDVPDRRAVRWVERPLAAVLALCAGAVVAGMCSFTAVAGWIADVPADLLPSCTPAAAPDRPVRRRRLRCGGW